MSLFTRHDAPRLRHLEIAASLVSRLAAWLRYSNALRFCFDFELDFGAVSAGDGGQLQKLAELTNTPVEELSHGPIREGRQFRIDGELLSTAYLDRIDTWICPDYAVEDMAAARHLAAEAAIAVRRDDIVSAIGNCARHRRGLVKVGRAAWKHGRHDTSLTTMDAGMRIGELQALSPQVEPSPIDVFARERFDGRLQGYALLDPMSLNQVLKLSGRFGNWLLTGGEANIRRLDRMQLNRTYSAGLDLLAAGEQAIAEAFETKRRQKAPDDTNGILTEVWAVLGDNRGEAAFEPVRQAIIAACGVQLTVTGRPQIVSPADEDLKWSLSYALNRLGLGPKALMAFAEAAGAFTTPAQDRVNVVRLKAWLGQDGGLISAHEAAKSVGVSSRQMRHLIDAGSIPCEIHRSGKQGSYDWLRKDQVEALRPMISDPVTDRKTPCRLADKQAVSP